MKKGIMNNVHVMVVTKKNGKKILEIGWDEAEIEKISGVYCLTKPYHWGSLTFGGNCGWTIFNLEMKEEIVEFVKKEDAIEYLDYLNKERKKQ